MVETQNQTALWTPGWYELDQTLSLGERQKYWFFQNPPEECLEYDRNIDFVFYNQLDSTKNCTVRFAKIVSMMHPVLGELLKIDTDGLDYIFFPMDGDEVVVNAEEEPGSTYESDVQISDWAVLVQLTDVSEPVAEIA